MSLPEHILHARKTICANCDCGVDFEDPCASCARLKWPAQPGCVPPPPDPKPTMPSLAEMAHTAAAAVAAEVKARLTGVGRVTDADIDARVAICEGCDFFVAESYRCIKCGCFLKFKTTLRSQHCPINKW